MIKLKNISILTSPRTINLLKQANDALPANTFLWNVLVLNFLSQKVDTVSTTSLFKMCR